MTQPERDLLTVFKYMQGFYPGPSQIGGPQVLNVQCTEYTSPVPQEMCDTMGHTYTGSQRCPLRNMSLGKGEAGSKSRVKSEPCRKQAHRPCEINYSAVASLSPCFILGPFSQPPTPEPCPHTGSLNTPTCFSAWTLT